MSCQKYEDKLIDYIEGKLSSKAELELHDHLMNCAACQRELEQQQEMLNLLDHEINRIEIPHDLMERVEEKVYQRRQKRNWKPSGWQYAAVVVALCILLLSTNVAPSMMNGMLHWWQSITSSQMASGDRIIGDEVNITAIDQDIRITITHVAADEFATVLYYEVEDLSKQGLYSLQSVDTDGLIKPGWNSRIQVPSPERYWSSKQLGPENNSIVIHEYEDLEEPYVVKGWATMHPMEDESVTIPIQIRNLNKVSFEEDSPFIRKPHIEELFAVSGEWDFEVPIIKRETKEYKIDQVIEVGGVEVSILSLKVAPTTSLLQYYYQDKNPHIEITIERLESGGKNYLPSRQHFSSDSRSGDERQTARFHTDHYESIYYDDPSEVRIYFGTISRKIKSTEQIYPINIDEPFPQKFEYLGSTISIDKVDIGTTTRMYMSLEDNPNRMFDSLDFAFTTNMGEYEQIGNLSGSQYYVDRAGNRYDWGKYYRPDTPFTTRTMDDNYQLYFSSSYPNPQDVIPSALRIVQYDQTRFLDDTVIIKLNLEARDGYQLLK